MNKRMYLTSGLSTNVCFAVVADKKSGVTAEESSRVGCKKLNRPKTKNADGLKIIEIGCEFRRQMEA
jgi:hypothetical protein